MGYRLTSKLDCSKINDYYPKGLHSRLFFLFGKKGNLYFIEVFKTVSFQGSSSKRSHTEEDL
ncbi:hypothetical protein AN964_15620 [Heyndrickxia shackletonii]|uniref:Uncharacterized protein n=1 Tax=Heyndrickxia shackletonii TaxID=157838 RepID=A0A0Q3WZH1_9BACI|nr:hypothetical protein AN964_15620 [Heyndrickxia shackletonii]